MTYHKDAPLPRGRRSRRDVRLEGGLVVGAEEQPPLVLQGAPEAAAAADAAAVMKRAPRHFQGSRASLAASAIERLSVRPTKDNHVT